MVYAKDCPRSYQQQDFAWVILLVHNSPHAFNWPFSDFLKVCFCICMYTVQVKSMRWTLMAKKAETLHMTSLVILNTTESESESLKQSNKEYQWKTHLYEYISKLSYFRPVWFWINDWTNYSSSLLIITYATVDLDLIRKDTWYSSCSIRHLNSNNCGCQII